MEFSGSFRRLLSILEGMHSLYRQASGFTEAIIGPPGGISNTFAIRRDLARRRARPGQDLVRDASSALVLTARKP
jgi:hypothetical protein